MIDGLSYSLGPTRRARRVAGICAMAAMAVSVWTFLKPYPFPIVIALCALAPWCAIAVATRWPGLPLLEEGPAEFGLPIVWMLPSLVLALRAFIHYEVVDYGWLFLAGIGAGAVLWIALLLTDTDGRSFAGLGWSALVCAVWGCATVVHLDGALARSRATLLHGTVASIDIGKRGQAFMDIATPGQRFEGVAVSDAIYALHRLDDPICLEVQRGLLGARYLYPATCPLV